jgi:hypothetical protein
LGKRTAIFSLEICRLLHVRAVPLKASPPKHSARTPLRLLRAKLALDAVQQSREKFDRFRIAVQRANNVQAERGPTGGEVADGKTSGGGYPTAAPPPAK